MRFGNRTMYGEGTLERPLPWESIPPYIVPTGVRSSSCIKYSEAGTRVGDDGWLTEHCFEIKAGLPMSYIVPTGDSGLPGVRLPPRIKTRRRRVGSGWGSIQHGINPCGSLLPNRGASPCVKTECGHFRSSCIGARVGNWKRESEPSALAWTVTGSAFLYKRMRFGGRTM